MFVGATQPAWGVESYGDVPWPTGRLWRGRGHFAPRSTAGRGWREGNGATGGEFSWAVLCNLGTGSVFVAVTQFSSRVCVV